MTDKINGLRHAHPSKRPVRLNTRKERPPSGVRGSEEPLTPGLRKSHSVQAIGFMAKFKDEDDD
jgi:hypothetical protein